MTKCSQSLTTIVAAFAVVAAVTAQSGVTREARPRYSLGIAAGASVFDLNGTGTATIVAVRFDAELHSLLVAEVSASVFQPDEQLLVS